MAVKKVMAQEPRIRMDKIKEVLIELTDLTKEPKFTFQGEWCGKDVRVVLRHISQAYRRHQIAKAKAMAKEQEQVLQPIGAING